jgi:hypothetical protein
VVGRRNIPPDGRSPCAIRHQGTLRAQMRKLFNYLMVLTVGLIAIWLVSLCIELFAAHLLGCILLWLLIPIIALWLNSRFIQERLGQSALQRTRLLLTVPVVAISLFCFSDYNHIRDVVGHRYVSGYEVSYEEDTDEFGRPYMASRVATTNWYSGVGLWAFGWLFVLACLLLPGITWEAATRALTRRRGSDSANDDVPVELEPEDG